MEYILNERRSGKQQGRPGWLVEPVIGGAGAAGARLVSRSGALPFSYGRCAKSWTVPDRRIDVWANQTHKSASLTGLDSPLFGGTTICRLQVRAFIEFDSHPSHKISIFDFYSNVIITLSSLRHGFSAHCGPIRGHGRL